MHGLYLLWWVQEQQMPAVVVAATLAAGDLALALLEIPTGWFADRVGHRASLIAGSVVQVAGMLCCWLGRGVPGLIAASLLVALGDAFRSGADQALLYRSCARLGREHDFQTIEARARAAQQAALVGLVIAGGAIVNAWGFAAGWAMETGLCAVGAAIACAMTEPPPAAVETEDATRAAGRTSDLLPLIALIAPAALLGAAASATSFLAQTTGGWDPGGVTIFVAIVSLAEAAGSAAAIRVRCAGRGAQAVLGGLGAASLALAVIAPAASLPVVVALAFLLGVAHPLRAVAIQRAVADHVRARAASLASACDMAVNVIVLPLAGAWRQRRRR
jgi:MFS family permease